MMDNRRAFLKKAGISALAFTSLTKLGDSFAAMRVKNLFFDISLAEWSYHKALFGKKMTNLDFPAAARKHGINAVEYVNQFFKDKAEDQTYLKELVQRSTDNGVKNLLIMIDGEGELANISEAARTKAIENHYKWAEAAKFLGCHSIRVNAAGEGTPEAVKAAAIDGLGRLCDYAANLNLNVIIENHGGLSSNGQWLSSVLKEVARPNVGTLPDFGNFKEYDKYKGIAEMMPFAKGVSGKTYAFDAQGNETTIDFVKMLKIVKDAGFKGYIDVEYEGDQLSEDEGIAATKLLLERVGAQLS